MSKTEEIHESVLTDFKQKLTEENPLRIKPEEFFMQVISDLIDHHKRKTVIPKAEVLLNRIQETSITVDHRVQFTSIGTVMYIGNGIATLSGLPDVQLEELVTFPSGVKGMVLNLDKSHVDVILLGQDEGIRGGDTALATGKRLRVPVGMQFLGRVIDPLGNPLDGKGMIIPSEYRLIERPAPGVIDRSPVNEPLYTGTKMIDALIPIGRGQRELILGDRQTGKTTLALDTIISQRGTDVKCVYVAIAQKKTSVLAAIEILEKAGVMPQTTVIVASPDDPPALRYIAPYVGATLTEFFLDQEMDSLIVYDDLSKHADSYRELSLLLRRPPGREAYPGDIFYLHSRLLERACKLNYLKGGNSITALPIVTTQKGNISAYIPTNLISITDGQIVLDADLFNKGNKPAINIGKSVSRVGGSAQEKAMKSVAGPLKLELSQYEEVARFAQFGSEVNETTQRQINRGLRLQSLLNQGPHSPVSLVDQVILFYALTNDYMDEIPVADIPEFSKDALNYLHYHEPQLIDKIKYQKVLDEESEIQLKEALNIIIEQWKDKHSETD